MKSRVYAFWHFLLAWFVRIIFFIIPRGRKNEPELTDGPYIVASNHISALDPIIICAVTRRQQPRFMSKAELFRVPVIGGIIRAWGAYPVDRGGRDAGVIKKTVSMIGEGKSIGIFPQGTRRPGTDPMSTPVRAGLGLICVHSKAQVLPVKITSRRMKVRPFRPVRVTVGKPIPYEEYTRGGESTDPAEITKYLFGVICSLDGEEKKDEDYGS